MTSALNPALPVTAWRTLAIHAAGCRGCATATLLLRWKAATPNEVLELLCPDSLERLGLAQPEDRTREHQGHQRRER